ncbi:MAG: peptidylprolyl isomerase [Thermoanaerobaculia bacterium]
MRSFVRLLTVIVAIFAVILVASCSRGKRRVSPDVISLVGDRPITLSDFKRYLDRNAGTALAEIAPEAASALLDQYVEEELLSEYAALHGIDVSAEQVAQAVRNDPGSTVMEKRDEMRRRKLIDQIAGETSLPSEQDIETFYTQHPDDFRYDERVRVRQILVHDETVANKIEADLRRGASFEDLSARYSAAPNAKNGGDIGWVSRGQLPRTFEDEIFDLPPGNVSRIIRTDDSYHIFRVDEHEKPGSLSFNEAEPLIRSRMQNQSLDDAVMKKVTEARKEIPVAILTDRLPFRYSGAFPSEGKE